MPSLRSARGDGVARRRACAARRLSQHAASVAMDRERRRPGRAGSISSRNCRRAGLRGKVRRVILEAKAPAGHRGENLTMKAMPAPCGPNGNSAPPSGSRPFGAPAASIVPSGTVRPSTRAFSTSPWARKLGPVPAHRRAVRWLQRPSGWCRAPFRLPPHTDAAARIPRRGDRPCSAKVRRPATTRRSGASRVRRYQTLAARVAIWSRTAAGDLGETVGGIDGEIEGAGRVTTGTARPSAALRGVAM